MDFGEDFDNAPAPLGALAHFGAPVPRSSSSAIYTAMKSDISPQADANAGRVLSIMKQSLAGAYLSKVRHDGKKRLGDFGEEVVITFEQCPYCGEPLQYVETHFKYEVPMCDAACSNCGAFYEVKTCFADNVDHNGNPTFMFNSKSVAALVAAKDDECSHFGGVFLVKGVDRAYFNYFCRNTESELRRGNFPEFEISFYDRESSFSTFLGNVGEIMMASEQSGTSKIAISEECM